MDSDSNAQAARAFGFDPGGGIWRAIRVTPEGRVAQIDTVHAQGHAGRLFAASKLWGEGGEIADNGNADIYFRCTMECHIIVEMAVGGDSEFYFFENPSITAPGTSMTIFNKRRASSNVSGCQMFHTPTVGSTGTQLWGALLPGGRGGHSDGGAASFNIEWVLKANNTYLLRTTNRSG